MAFPYQNKEQWRKLSRCRCMFLGRDSMILFVFRRWLLTQWMVLQKAFHKMYCLYFVWFQQKCSACWCHPPWSPSGKKAKRGWHGYVLQNHTIQVKTRACLWSAKNVSLSCPGITWPLVIRSRCLRRWVLLNQAGWSLASHPWGMPSRHYYEC